MFTNTTVQEAIMKKSEKAAHQAADAAPQAAVNLDMVRKYRSHKIVTAMRIDTLEPYAKGETVGEYAINGLIAVEKSYMDKHNPQVGGYWVQYDDGYQSWSPAEAFESGYTLVGDEEQADRPSPALEEAQALQVELQKQLDDANKRMAALEASFKNSDAAEQRKAVELFANAIGILKRCAPPLLNANPALYAEVKTFLSNVGAN